MKKYTWFAGHFDDHVDATVQCGAHCPMEHNQGFTRSHWTSPRGNYLHRIALARLPWSLMAATQQAHKKKLLVLQYITAYAKLVKKDTKGTLYSSHSKCKFIEIAIDKKKAETVGIFSSYQTLKLDKNSWRNSSPKKLKK